MVGMTPFGVLTFFVLDTLLVVRGINLVSGVVSVCTGISIVFVCFHLTRIIRKAKRKARAPAHAFYDQAARKLWGQVATLSVFAITWIAAVVSLEPRLAGVGVRTPIIPHSIMIVNGIVGLTVATCLARAGSVRAASPAPVFVKQALAHKAVVEPSGDEPTPPRADTTTRITPRNTASAFDERLAQSTPFASSGATLGTSRVVPVVDLE